MFVRDIREGMRIHLNLYPSTRAIRYAIAELIKSGRAKRKGQSGPVYAVVTVESEIAHWRDQTLPKATT